MINDDLLQKQEIEMKHSRDCSLHNSQQSKFSSKVWAVWQLLNQQERSSNKNIHFDIKLWSWLNKTEEAQGEVTKSIIFWHSL